MLDTTKQAIALCVQASHAGQITFGTAVGQLMQLGVQSYHADLRADQTTFYDAADASCALPLHGPDAPIADGFDAAQLQAAIRGAQAGSVQYPQFLALARAAGCVAYTVWITGRHVAYVGRRGEVHIEQFPR